MSVLHCVVCAGSIPSSDFDRRLAATVLKRHYCRVCSETIAAQGRPDLRGRTLRVRGSSILAAAVGSLALIVLLCLLISRR